MLITNLFLIKRQREVNSQFKSAVTLNYTTPVEFLKACWIAQWGIQLGQQGITSALNLGLVVTQM